MKKEIIDFINSQRVCVLAVEMMDGSPHASTVHFALSEDPFIFFFETYRPYLKCEPLFGKDITRASVVVGFDETDMKTLQLDGEARLITNKEKQLFNKIYLGKFPEKIKKSLDPDFIYFCFTPKWWRFTDWTLMSGKIIITSEDK